MTKDTKILVGVLVFSFLLIVGFAVWQGGKGETNKEVLWEFRFRCIPNELNTLKQTIENNLRINETFKNLKIRK